MCIRDRKSAVLIFPTCKYPVGEGANLVTIFKIILVFNELLTSYIHYRKYKDFLILSYKRRHLTLNSNSIRAINLGFIMLISRFKSYAITSLSELFKCGFLFVD